MLRAATLAVTVLLALPCAAADIMGQATVIDGNTIEIHGQRVRLYGIDAPESAQTCTAHGKVYRCGQQAALALANFIRGRTIRCVSEGAPDRYGRMIAVCRTEWGLEDLASWMCQQGWALAYRRYSNQYENAEIIGKANGRGMWRGMFVTPWDWRKNH